MERICGIYKIENRVNKKMYIGSSVDIYRRFRTHIGELKRNKHSNSYLQYAWNKYGDDNFEFKIITTCNEKDLVVKEQKQFDVLWDTKLLYNIVNKAGNIAIKENRINRRTRAVCCYNLDGDFVKRFNSITEAFRYYGINGGGLSRIVGNGKRTLANFYWVYAGEKLKMENTFCKLRKRRVYCYNREREIIKIFKSTSDAERFFNVSRGEIYRACKGIKLSSAGYFWCYEGDEMLIRERKKNYYKPVKMYNYKTNEFLGIFESVSEAARQINTCQSNVKSVCDGRSRYAKEYRFEYV